METTFMTIHNLNADANILFASESIVDVLGYQPYEVIGQSCFEYFHPDEVPLARYKHDRSIQLDKASVLYYSRIKARDGNYVSCECVFSVVYDVLVACTSVYHQGSMQAERRALEAPQIRRIFASSPRDPRYHMLEHLSSRFRNAPSPPINEPRAALILNRFSREIPIMYATNAVLDILGVSAQEITSRSFYECITENCLPEAIRSLESAKANDSIAYLRFMFRDPRHDENVLRAERELSHSSDSEDGGVPIDAPTPQEAQRSSSSEDHPMHSHSPEAPPLVDRTHSSSSATHTDPEGRSRSNRRRQTSLVPAPLELEAVVSCTSDGLVVILRRARPSTAINTSPTPIFAAPWGVQTILPPHHAYIGPGVAGHYDVPAVAGVDFMASIREVAVFAWSLTGINGNIANYSHGIPRGEAIPPGGFPVWDPHAVAPRAGITNLMDQAPQNQAQEKWEEWEREGRVGARGYERADGWRERGGRWVIGGSSQYTNQPDSRGPPPYTHAHEEQVLEKQESLQTRVPSQQHVNEAGHLVNPPEYQPLQQGAPSQQSGQYGAPSGGNGQGRNQYMW